MEITISFCGDIMLGAGVARQMEMDNMPVCDWLEGVSDAWRGADLLIGNLEGPCVITARPVDGQVPELTLYGSSGRIPELRNAGFSAVTLANNHILDCGPRGLAETIRCLDEAGIYHAGAGMNLAESLEPAFIPAAGHTIGLVSFCYGPPAGRSTAGVAPNEPKLMRKALLTARSRADVVIAALHDGLEYSDVPPTETRNRFQFLAENGADIVIGHHPHVLQGLEWHKKVPIAYSLGDLLFDNCLPDVMKSNFARMAMALYAPEEVQRDGEKFSRGAVLTVCISQGQKSIQWCPFRQDHKLRPYLSVGDLESEDLRRLEDLSAALLNEQDPRHSLADSVIRTAWWEERKNLSLTDLIQLALKPKWRYLPHGIEWLYRRIMSA